LKKDDPKLKVLLTVGGSNHKSTGFTDMVRTKETRKKFITEVYKYLSKYSKFYYFKA